jgi:pimeloyl-ACP methyl ester carboxylesterase
MAAPRLTRVRPVVAITCALLGLVTSVSCSAGRSSRDDATSSKTTIDDGSTATTRPGFVEPGLIPNSEAAAFTASDGTALIGQLFGTGKGPAVVLLHASNSDMRAWFPFAQRLAKAGTVVLAFDFRGYGQSGGQQDPSAYPVDVTAAFTFLENIGNKPIALVGVEVGGTAAVVAAAGAQSDISALAVFGAGPKFGPLDAGNAASDVRAKTVVYSSGSDGGDALAGLIKGSELRRTAAPSDPTKDAATQDALALFLSTTLDKA